MKFTPDPIRDIIYSYQKKESQTWWVHAKIGGKRKNFEVGPSEEYARRVVRKIQDMRNYALLYHESFQFSGLADLEAAA
jgi:hypothetical protein